MVTCGEHGELGKLSQSSASFLVVKSRFAMAAANRRWKSQREERRAENDVSAERSGRAQRLGCGDFSRDL